jgi:hypothetical protein
MTDQSETRERRDGNTTTHEWWTGDKSRTCLSAEDRAVINGDLPAPRSPYEGTEPGKIREWG